MLQSRSAAFVCLCLHSLTVASRLTTVYEPLKRLFLGSSLSRWIRLPFRFPPTLSHPCRLFRLVPLHLPVHFHLSPAPYVSFTATLPTPPHSRAALTARTVYHVSLLPSPA